VTRLVTDTGTGDALPLLAFTLQQLAADVPRGGHRAGTQLGPDEWSRYVPDLPYQDACTG
jgi:hypothetical protein